MSTTAISPTPLTVGDDKADLLIAAYRQLPMMLGMTVAAVVVFALLLWKLFPPAFATAWVAVMLSVAVLRGLLAFVFLRSIPAASALNVWRWLFLIGSALAGLSWGLGAAAMIPTAGGAELAIIVGIIMSVSAVSIASMSGQHHSQRVFAIGALLPPAAAVWMKGGYSEQMLALIVLAGLGCVLLVGRRTTATIAAMHEAQAKLRAAALEAELNHAKQHLHALVERSPDPINVILEGNIVYCNPAGLQLFGAVSPEQVIGKSALDFVHPDDVPKVLDRQTQIANGATELPQLEIKFVRLDGTVVDCESQGNSVFFGGKPAVQYALRDVTARNKTEAALAESLARTQLLLGTASVGLWEWEFSTGKVYYSPEWKRHLGYDDHELQNVFEEWQSRVHPEDLATVMVLIEEFRQGQRSKYQIEFRMRHRDGTWHWYFSQADFLRDSAGTPIRMIGSQIDITKSRRDADALRENELRLRLALRGANLGLWDWDAESSHLIVNARWLTMLGLDGDGPMPTIDDWHSRVHPDDMPKLQQLMAEVINNPAAIDFEAEIRALHSNGEYLWILDKGAVVTRNADGSPQRIVGTHMDITERKQAEGVRQSLEAQLRESQKMQAIGTLAGGVAHDFNNILAAILGNAELARLDSASPDVLESLEEIRRAGTRGRNLVQQILSFSRRQPTEKKRVEMSEVVGESVRLLRATLPARITLITHYAPDVPTVLADATQLEQVLINLANNAAHAIPTGTGHIDIRLDTVVLDAALSAAHPANAGLHTLYEKCPGRTVRLSVSDDGVGMDDATLRRIFEPFFTTKPVNEGTGLGLSVVHGIIESHRGAIVVDSEVGRGTTFTIYLPIAERQDSTVEGEQAGRSVDAERFTNDEVRPLVTSGSPHILYLDDDEALLFLVSRLLERRGYRVSAYSNQAEALKALAASPDLFTLVVTDYNMPGKSGLDVATDILAIRPNLPVAVASGFVDETLRARASVIGVRELIYKQNVVEDFSASIARLVQIE